MKLTEDEITNILEVQDRARRKLGTDKKVSCPFYEIRYSNFLDICILCHKWMETNLDNGHPCTDLRYNMKEVRERFWRNPRRINNA